MPNNFDELERLLEQASAVQRRELGEAIGCGFGYSPKLICDHICFLRAGAIGQMFDKRDYKQLVTDVADRVRIDWASLTARKKWAELKTEEIEAAIVERIGTDQLPPPDTQFHIPEPVLNVVREFLDVFIARNPKAAVGAPFVDRGLVALCQRLNTDWQKLMIAVLYVHTVIRPSIGT